MSYPLVLTNLAHARCVVIGGGTVAERKVRGLLDGQAQPEVISPSLTERLAAWRAAGRITHTPRTYQKGDLAKAFIAIAATNDRATNAAVALEARQRGILVNVTDDPLAGNFHSVATMRRADLLLTVSTSGSSPALAAHIRRELETRYGDEYALLLAMLRELRDGPAGALESQQRARLWRTLVADEQLLAWIRSGHTQRAKSYMCRQLDALAKQQGVG